MAASDYGGGGVAVYQEHREHGAAQIRGELVKVLRLCD